MEFLLILGFLFIYNKLESIRNELYKLRTNKTKLNESNRAVQDTHKSNTYSV